MDTPKSLCLVSYAVNGSGLGHLSRLIAINRWLRRYAAVAGVRTQHYFLTTSEAEAEATRPPVLLAAVANER